MARARTHRGRNVWAAAMRVVSTPTHTAAETMSSGATNQAERTTATRATTAA